MDKILSFLHKALLIISFGKYQTTLYTKTGLPFQSSLIGGLLTLVLGGAILATVIQQLIVVFSKTHYNLNTDSQILQGYLYTDAGAGGLSPDSVWYTDKKPTKDLRLRDFSRLIDDSFLLTLYLDPS